MSVASIISTKHDFASELEEILDYNIASNKGMFLSKVCEHGMELLLQYVLLEF